MGLGLRAGRIGLRGSWGLEGGCEPWEQDSAEAESGRGLQGVLTFRGFSFVLVGVLKGLLQAPLASFKQLGSHLVMGVIEAREPQGKGRPGSVQLNCGQAGLHFKERGHFSL